MHDDPSKYGDHDDPANHDDSANHADNSLDLYYAKLSTLIYIFCSCLLHSQFPELH